MAIVPYKKPSVPKSPWTGPYTKPVKAELPEVSSSEGKQQRHIREYESGKRVIINPDVEKQKERDALLRQQRLIRKVNVARRKQFVLPLRAKETQISTLPARQKWYQILKSDFRPLVKSVKDELEAKGDTLLPGESIVVVTDFAIPELSKYGFFSYKEVDGSEGVAMVPMSRGIDSDKFVEFVEKMHGKRQRIIVSISVDDSLTDIGNGLDLEREMPRAWLKGWYRLNYVRPIGSGIKYKPTPQGGNMASRQIPGGHMFYDPKDPKKVRLFKNAEEARKALWKAWQTPYDLFGKRWVPQTRISDDFKAMDFSKMTAEEMYDFARKRMGGDIPETAKILESGRIGKSSVWQLIFHKSDEKGIPDMYDVIASELGGDGSIRPLMAFFINTPSLEKAKAHLQKVLSQPDPIKYSDEMEASHTVKQNKIRQDNAEATQFTNHYETIVNKFPHLFTRTKAEEFGLSFLANFYDSLDLKHPEKARSFVKAHGQDVINELYGVLGRVATSERDVELEQNLGQVMTDAMEYLTIDSREGSRFIDKYADLWRKTIQEILIDKKQRTNRLRVIRRKHEFRLKDLMKDPDYEHIKDINKTSLTGIDKKLWGKIE